MKNVLSAAAAFAILALGGIAVQAQTAQSVNADSNAAFASMQPDSNGTVAQSVLHAPAGDVLALYIGRMPKQMYSKQDDLLYVISGYGTAEVGYPSFNVKPGSVISIPRNTAFEITATGGAPIKAILVASPHDNPEDKKIL